MAGPSRARARAPVQACVFGLAVALAGCVHPRNFQDPQTRITGGTAYAEQARIRLDTDLLASDPQVFVANIGLTAAAIPRHLDFSVNLAHGSIGVVNVQSKFTMLDTRWYALGGRVGLTYLNPRTFYFLPRDIRRKLGSFNLMSVPIELWHSFPLTTWFSFHLGMGYRATELWGDFRGNELLIDTSIAQRRFVFQPVLHFYVAKRVALLAGARLPVWSQTVEATDAQVEIAPEVILGARSVEWVDRPLIETIQVQFGAETRFGRNTYMMLGVNLWAFRPIEVLTVTPTFSLYWRFL